MRIGPTMRALAKRAYIAGMNVLETVIAAGLWGFPPVEGAHFFVGKPQGCRPNDQLIELE